jgi:hypothetical protein
MKYQCEIEINLPRAEVVEKMDSAENMYKWQQGLISHEFTEGEPGAVGSKMKLNYKMGKREVEMVETILVSNFPDKFDAQYEAKNVHNVVRNTFIEIDANKTKWITDNEFKMSGFMKVFAFLMPGMFKKQSMKYLVAFKDFAETGKTVN